MASCQHDFNSTEINEKFVHAFMLIFPDFGAILQINTCCIFCDANVAKETEHRAVEVVGGEQKKIAAAYHKHGQQCPEI